MECFNGHNTFGYHYRPWEDTGSYKDEPWHPNQEWRYMDEDNTFASVNPPSTMQRYLQEYDRSWFTADQIYDSRPSYSAPSLDTGPLTHIDEMAYVPNRLPSPSSSGPSISNTSSSWSDRQGTPSSSPGPSVVAYTPKITYAEDIPSGYGGDTGVQEARGAIINPCVALHDVQYMADEQPENTAFDDGQVACYMSSPQEGYQPLEGDAEVTRNKCIKDSAVTCGSCADSPNLRRRRATITQSTSPSRGPSRVTKRPAAAKRSSSYQTKAASNGNGTCGHSSSNKTFPCLFATYGCGSGFGSKNEWKRHVNTQHMRTGYWHCDRCDGGDRKPNDFNRKDLFMQHVRRMHPLQTAETKTTKTKPKGSRSPKKEYEDCELTAIATSCYRTIRSPPEESGCHFCDMRFRGPSTWDERLEHMGRHLECAKKEQDKPVDPKNWQEDTVLQTWLVHEGIVVACGKRWILADRQA
ncbi:hypothetical protein LTR37_002667 [Vermiconidia calcicola]|uniref:Uncharacterized protein n=1 Tax=Vermiconidia calcicola TaxID=1690605 RepID=A0ACC3NU55_9PEZI|nr:hypothetical protein LTR37_002667 [Vermiconidia calcicola]